MNYLLICISILLISCIESNGKKAVQPTIETIPKSFSIDNPFPYTNQNVSKFYIFDPKLQIYIVTGVENNSMKFKNEELDFPIKENEFNIHPTVQEKFAVVDTLNFSSSLISKIIIYNTFGDNDTPILNVQLNSYLNGNLKDQLLLDSRFTFETEYFRTFEIQEDQKIRIHKFSVNHLEFNDVGDILGEKEVPDTLKVTVDYKLMNDGIFKKI